MHVCMYVCTPIHNYTHMYKCVCVHVRAGVCKKETFTWQCDLNKTK